MKRNSSIAAAAFVLAIGLAPAKPALAQPNPADLSYGDTTAGGVRFPAKPSEGASIVDEAEMLDSAEAAEIELITEALARDLGFPIYAVTITSLAAQDAAGYTLDRYATALFNHWAIGSAKFNYGMLLVLSRGDRGARIELGAGWGNVHNAKAQRVMDGQIIPLCKRGDYSGALLAGVRGMDAMARGLDIPRARAPVWAPFVTIGGILLIAAIIFSLFRNGLKGWGWILIAALGGFLIMMLLSGGRRGGGDGGGFSGGGGASGSW